MINEKTLFKNSEKENNGRCYRGYMIFLLWGRNEVSDFQN